MNKRPPLLGYNHNVRHTGRLYHVQTEDSGPAKPHLTTHVFYRGIILSTARQDYAPEEPDAVVQRLMQSQHKGMLKQLRDGAFDEKMATLEPSPELVLSPVAAEAEPEVEALALLADEGSVAPGPLRQLLLDRLDAPGAMVATTEPYTQAMPGLAPPARPVPPEEISLLTDAELSELIDLAAGSLEGTGPAFSQSSYRTMDGDGGEEDRVMELEAEPPSEDEIQQVQRSTTEPPTSHSTPSRSSSSPVSSSRSPRRIAVWSPTGGFVARQRSPSSASQPPEAPGAPPEDLPPEPTRVRMSPQRSLSGGYRQAPARPLRTAPRRHDGYRPRPTAEGVVIQRPLIVSDQSAPAETRPPPEPTTDPRIPTLSADERTLDQVILAYLAEDSNSKKK